MSKGWVAALDGWILQRDLNIAYDPDAVRGLPTRAQGQVWQAVDFSWHWGVVWNGHLMKQGSGCIDSAEARRAVEAYLDLIEQGYVERPWKRELLQQRIEDARSARKQRDLW